MRKTWKLLSREREATDCGGVMKKLIIYLLIAVSLYGSQVDFSQGEKGKLILLPQGEVRIIEDFVPDQPGKEVVINNLDSGVDMDSLVVEGEEISELIVQGGAENGYTVGKYRGEEFRLISVVPLIIENLESREVLINPSEEIKFKSLKNANNLSLSITGEKSISNIRLNYNMEGLKWEREYSLYLNKGEMRKGFFIENSSGRNFKNILPVFSRVNENANLSRIDLENNMKIKRNLSREKKGIVKSYVYKENIGERYPKLNLEIDGVDMDTSDKIKVFDGDGYLGEFKGENENRKLRIGGISEDQIQVESYETEKNLGMRLKQKKVNYLIKNYKKETAVLKIIYDKLPKKWNELRSDIDYEIVEKTVVFTIKIPANSRKEIKISFIEEKK